MSSLKRILCKQLPVANRPTPLDETEATHATRVLRLKDGDSVEALDGKGHAIVAKLRTRNGPARIEFIPEALTDAEVEISKKDSSSQLVPIVLEMAVLKGDAMEWVVEKAVELGVTTLVPVLTAHTVVQMDRKGPEAFQERWQKIADQALKQCGRLARLEVKAPIAFAEMLTPPLDENAVRIWCDETEKDSAPSLLHWLEESRSKNFSPLHLLIGPEGGWSQNEREILSREQGTKQVTASLGPLVLRAETAAIFSVSILAADLRIR
jgi:16S rRNA (uracil1498-N3)-methyltransferase